MSSPKSRAVVRPDPNSHVARSLDPSDPPRFGGAWMLRTHGGRMVVAWWASSPDGRMVVMSFPVMGIGGLGFFSRVLQDGPLLVHTFGPEIATGVPDLSLFPSIPSK